MSRRIGSALVSLESLRMRFNRLSITSNQILAYQGSRWLKLLMVTWVGKFISIHYFREKSHKGQDQLAVRILITMLFNSV